MRIVEAGQHLPAVRPAVVVRVLDEEDLPPRGEEEPPLAAQGQGHGLLEAIGEDRGGLAAAVAEGRSKQTAQQTAAAEALATIEAMPIELPPSETPADSVDGTVDPVEAPAT